MYLTGTEIILGITYFFVLYLSIFWLLALFDASLPQKKQFEDFPGVTVIIPAYNEEETIQTCLATVQQLNYPRLSLIVVDDG